MKIKKLIFRIVVSLLTLASCKNCGTNFHSVFSVLYLSVRKGKYAAFHLDLFCGSRGTAWPLSRMLCRGQATTVSVYHLCRVFSKIEPFYNLITFFITQTNLTANIKKYVGVSFVKIHLLKNRSVYISSPRERSRGQTLAILRKIS